jgi:hypothetical protein
MLILSHFIGPRVSEYAQTTQDKVDYHVYPSGTHAFKAFTANDFVFYDKSGHVLKKNNDSTLDLATSMQITWCIKKIVKTVRRLSFLQTQRTLQYALYGEHC